MIGIYIPIMGYIFACLIFMFLLFIFFQSENVKDAIKIDENLDLRQYGVGAHWLIDNNILISQLPYKDNNVVNYNYNLSIYEILNNNLESSYEDEINSILNIYILNNCESNCGKMQVAIVRKMYYNRLVKVYGE